ncbi:MAG TPA: bifunctional tRNA (5-methylaminomethyl-2-thiouridine)(34)-methyltransferase MnmD/FAD-dependent 5-carboxymethylaminomethyl-2-thiouridine(34) oxidoreductase MnmC [Rhodocyclaceae bacterium]|nr:bifunctional tRNA (5-methylaminomethyl-2-thiouridine)(34)-methyltransferase MnmD/FAD-dependent 5-carboxymethylaminomethyl-2-thiouridine(34) oxidoreductase MnmC [Rhodocyclaceae bacterium]
MIKPARLAYAPDGTPYSASFDDVYHSTEGGLDQARYVFLGGNKLPERWQQRERFTILETGFGLGLSFLATWQAWRNDPQRCAHLHFVSTELNPFQRADLIALHQRWPELNELASELHANWPPLTPGFHHLVLDQGRVSLTLLFGDALRMLPELSGQADAIYLDGFAPQKNPALWSQELLSAITKHAAPDATLASWCVAGEVKSMLRELGWHLKKRPGFAHKWHMLCGAMNGTAVSSVTPQNAIVIGAGIAGCSAAEALARRGWQVTLLERHAAAAQEASGNPVGLLHPILAKDDNLAARFSRAAYLYSLRLLQSLGHETVRWQACGILQVAEDTAQAATYQANCATFPADYVSWLDREEASTQAGLPVSAGACWFPHGAHVNPKDFCQALLNAAGPNLNIRYATTVASLHFEAGLWHARDSFGHSIATAEHIVLANANAANELLPELVLSLRPIRGQLSYLPAAALDDLRSALCGVGYAIRDDEQCVIGASFIEGSADVSLRADEHADNMARLARLLPELKIEFKTENLPGRVSFRAVSHDRMPLVGTLPQAQLKVQHTLANLPRQNGLHALLGFGARGLSWAPLAAELLAARLTGATLPLENALVRSLDPARFHLRWHRSHNRV